MSGQDTEMESQVVEDEPTQNLFKEEKSKRSVSTRNESVTEREKISPKQKKCKINQQIIYVMPGPIGNVNIKHMIS